MHSLYVCCTALLPKTYRGFVALQSRLGEHLRPSPKKRGPIGRGDSRRMAFVACLDHGQYLVAPFPGT